VVLKGFNTAATEILYVLCANLYQSQRTQSNGLDAAQPHLSYE